MISTPSFDTFKFVKLAQNYLKYKMAAHDKTWTYLYGIFWWEGQEAGDESAIFF
jgi:hypothetical protein